MKGMIRKLSCILLIAAITLTAVNLLPVSAAGMQTQGVADIQREVISNAVKSLNGASVSGIKNRVYNGKAQKQNPTVKLGTKTLVSGTDYTVSHKNNKNVGTATVIITGKGNYSGTIKKTFKINPASTTIASLSADTGSITVKWNKQTTQTSGYQVQYSTGSGFSSASSVSGAASAVSKVIKGLQSAKTYYVRIRTFKKIDDKKYYSSWSAAKSIKTKSKSSSPSTPTNPTTVYITKSGEKYHRDGCKYLAKSKIPISKSEAVAKGYTPCSVCKPG